MTGDRSTDKTSRPKTNTKAAAKAQVALATDPATDPQALTSDQAEPMSPDETVEPAQPRKEAAQGE
ncbi:hypothetical protein [Almyronema epifaneia]|uniref:Uncharacterized protein n=1 Tax=Almyronema epifaneia S1 TaxID=2991925 RepID=A0ABW6IDX9_9CYAN